MHASLLLYGLVAYLLFFAAILYGIGFVGNLRCAQGNRRRRRGRSIDGDRSQCLAAAAVCVQHNVMARPWFKDWWTQFVPRPIERSTYVARASLILMLLYWQWRPMPEIVWHVDNAIGRGVLWVLYFAGWAIVFYSSFVIDHFELFGLKQVWMTFVDGNRPWRRSASGRFTVGCAIR